MNSTASMSRAVYHYFTVNSSGLTSRSTQ